MQELGEKYYKLIAINFKRIRNGLGLTQEALSEKLDCYREHISLIENRRVNPSLKILLVMADLFEFSPKEFFKEE